jgi:hypothetical protein
MIKVPGTKRGVTGYRATYQRGYQCKRYVIVWV